MDDLLEAFKKTQLGAIHAQLEKQDEHLDEMPTTDDIEKLQKIIRKLNQKTESMVTKRLDAFEEIILDVAKNVKELKPGKLFWKRRMPLFIPLYTFLYPITAEHHA